MEEELKAHLLSCSASFVLASGKREATVATSSAGDWRFFDRLRDGKTSFRVSTYDSVMRWFSTNWPAGAEWPAGVPRPLVAQPEQVAS